MNSKNKKGKNLGENFYIINSNGCEKKFIRMNFSALPLSQNNIIYGAFIVKFHTFVKLFSDLSIKSMVYQFK